MKKKLLNILSAEEFDKKVAEDVKTLFQFNDIENLILRGHIQIEHALDDAIKRTVFYDEHYNPDRFTFSQKHIIACMVGVSDKFISKIKLFNKLRNQIAHTLHHDIKSVEELVNLFSKNNPGYDEDRKNPFTVISALIGQICGRMSAIPILAKMTQAFDVMEQIKIIGAKKSQKPPKRKTKLMKKKPG